MHRSPLRDFIVGLFVLAGLGALTYLSMSVGGLSFASDGGLQLYASFDQIGGLKPRAPVVLAGVKIGQIKSIALSKDFRARVELDLKKDIELPVDTSASIMTSGLLGDQYVSLELGGDEKVLKSGDEISITESAVILERLIGKLIHSTDVKKEE